MTKIGQFTINRVEDKYAIIFENEVIHIVDDFNSGIKLIEAFNKVYKRTREKWMRLRNF